MIYSRGMVGSIFDVFDRSAIAFDEQCFCFVFWAFAWKDWGVWFGFWKFGIRVSNVVVVVL